jgi:hypothetical protein
MRIVRVLCLTIPVYLIATTAFGQVFPVFPIGTLPDGSFYRSTLTIGNLSSVADTSCTLRIKPNTNVNIIDNFTITKASWSIQRPPSLNINDMYVPSYAVVSCNQPISVEVRYALYSGQSLMIGEATVPPSSPVNYAAFVIDHVLDATRTGLAIANDSDVAVSATVTVYDSNNTNIPLKQTLTIDPRSTLTEFVDEITGWKGSLALITVSASSPFCVTGLRFTGPIFSTLLPILTQ